MHLDPSTGNRFNRFPQIFKIELDIQCHICRDMSINRFLALAKFSFDCPTDTLRERKVNLLGYSINLNVNTCQNTLGFIRANRVQHPF